MARAGNGLGDFLLSMRLPLFCVSDYGEGGGAGHLGVQGPETDDEAVVLHVGVSRVHGVLHAIIG